MFCPNCGTDLPDEAIFCFSCGTDIKSIQDRLAEEETSEDSVEVLAEEISEPIVKENFVPAIENTPKQVVEPPKTPVQVEEHEDQVYYYSDFEMDKIKETEAKSSSKKKFIKNLQEYFDDNDIKLKVQDAKKYKISYSWEKKSYDQSDSDTIWVYKADNTWYVYNDAYYDD